MVLLSSAADEPIDPRLWIGLVIIVFIIVLLVLGIVLIIRKITKSTKSKQTLKRTAQFYKAQYGAAEAVYMKHIAGLPLIAGSMCWVMLRPQGLLFEYNHTAYDLSFEKIRDIRTKDEVPPQYNSVRTVFGYDGRTLAQKINRILLFDIWNPRNGIARKLITHQPISCQFHITYIDKDKPKLISLQCPDTQLAKPFVTAYFSRPPIHKNISL